MKVTSPEQWSRRKVLAAGLGFTGAMAACSPWDPSGGIDSSIVYNPKHIEGITRFDQYHSYSNAYEFGTNKSDPSRYEHEAVHLLEDWTVDFDGTVLDIDQLMGMNFNQLDEEVFDFRCVEAWAMRIHYNGFPLSRLLEKYGDTSKKYVAFYSAVDKETFRGQGWGSISWPYREALTMEEAMHPLTWAVFGNYGVQSMANGAPFRINIPWKWGFKSPKFVVKVECTDEMPESSWNTISSREYGWFSNVYPDIPHPRWSQRTHRSILEDGTTRQPTLPYNGYEEQVAHLYPGGNRKYR